MARSHSPGYPNFGLPKAVQQVEKIFNADRRNPIDRLVAVKHIGYTSLSGASDKALGTLAHFDLIERVGKGEVRVTERAVDILHSDTPEARRQALYAAGFAPSIFKDLRQRFSGSHVSEEAIRSFLKRENFLDRAINPVTTAYMETLRFLEQEKALESDGAESEDDADLQEPDDNNDLVYGGANIGDLVQWESEGTLQFGKPLPVRAVSDDGRWIWVEGSETGIPMSQVIVEEKTPPKQKEDPPKLPLSAIRELRGEHEWLRGPLSRDVSYRLIVVGEPGPKELGKLIRLLQAQRAILSDEDVEEAADRQDSLLGR